MISNHLTQVEHLRPSADALAQQVAQYLAAGGKISQGASFTGTPIPPKRRDWIDPETVLKRKPPRISAAERKRLRHMAEAI
jgi:hypothetical protein